MSSPDELAERIAAAAARYDGPDDEAARLTAAALARAAWRLRRGGKVCSACKAKKPVAAFGRNRSRRDGLHPHCLECERKRQARSTTTSERP